MTATAIVFLLLTSQVQCSGDITGNITSAIETVVDFATSPEEFLLSLLNSSAPEDFHFTDSPEEEVAILVYSNGQFANFTNETIDRNKHFKAFVHGWHSNGQTDDIRDVANNYGGKYNFVSFDWSELASDNYFTASSSVRGVGNTVGWLVWQLSEKDDAVLSDFHLIGHSLGAHVAGFAGQWLRKNANSSVGRITGLDPASPLFQVPVLRPRHWRLSEDDGGFVDVIHSDKHFYGMSVSIGKVDIFVNSGGPIQPGCKNSSFTDPLYPISCSHSMAVKTFAASIVNPRNFKAKKCCNEGGRRRFNKKIVIGEYINKNARGNYYLKTNSSNNIDLQ